MRPFTMYHFISHSFSASAENLVSHILEVIRAEKIYFLGASLYRRRSESIFCTEAPTSQHTGDYFFLILVNNLNNKTFHEWQDKIEQHCSCIMAVTSIVLEIATFNDWLKTGSFFARKVLEASVVLYDGGNECLSLPENYSEEEELKSFSKDYLTGLNKAQEFLAGADLFRIREQNKMAAFMLHQSAEQALRTILKIGTGFHSCTHSIERLIRYASMVSYKLPDVFPRKTESEKRIFNLLQKAYIDTRYKDDYTINIADLLLLTDRVRSLQEFLVDAGKDITSGNKL